MTKLKQSVNCLLFCLDQILSVKILHMPRINISIFMVALNLILVLLHLTMSQMRLRYLLGSYEIECYYFECFVCVLYKVAVILDPDGVWLGRVFLFVWRRIWLFYGNYCAFGVPAIVFYTGIFIYFIQVHFIQLHSYILYRYYICHVGDFSIQLSICLTAP